MCSHFFTFKNVHIIFLVLSWEWESLSYTTSKLILTSSVSKLYDFLSLLEVYGPSLLILFNSSTETW